MNFFKLNLHWKKTTDPFFPYSVCSEGKRMKLRLNDFPEEPMYTLIVDDEIIESFDDWPTAWSRAQID